MSWTSGREVVRAGNDRPLRSSTGRRFDRMRPRDPAVHGDELLHEWSATFWIRPENDCERDWPTNYGQGLLQALRFSSATDCGHYLRRIETAADHERCGQNSLLPSHCGEPDFS